MRAAGGRAQYVSCVASGSVVRDGGGPSPVEDASSRRRAAASAAAARSSLVRVVRREPRQWDVRAPALRPPASAGARGEWW